MGIKLLAGRTLSDTRPMDDATTPSPASPEVQQALVQRGVNILVSREAARRLGFASPQQPLGTQIKTSIVDSDYGLEIGKATSRDRVCQAVYDSVVAVV